MLHNTIGAVENPQESARFMNEIAEAPRPLSFGEIFDRAVTLYVRNFVPFSIMLLLVIVPVTIVEYFGDHSSGQSLSEILAQISRARAGAPAPPPQFGIFWALALTVLLTPLANVAVAIGVARASFGKRFTPMQCYGAAVARWPAIFGLTVLAAVIFFSAVFAGTLGVTLLAVLSFLLLRTVVAAGIALAVLSVVAALVWLASLVLMVVALGFAYYAIGIEGDGIVGALGGGFGRVFNRREIGKALLLCFALAAIEVGALVIFTLLLALASGFVHSRAILLAANAAVSVFSSAFTAVLLAVYYFDVRTRREGLDLQASLDRLARERPVSA